MAKIETGVDKLVELVGNRKKLTLEEASKELGVSVPVVQEWAEFLEEEGLISIHYSLSKTYLSERKLSQKDVSGKQKEYENKKESFVRKIDTTLKQLERDAAGFEDIRKAYNSLKADIGDEIDQVKHELDELRHYETLKQSIDQDIIQQKMDYQKTIDDVHRKLHAEEKRYEKILSEIKIETDQVAKEKKNLEETANKQESLKKRLDALKEVIKEIDDEIGASSRSIAQEEERVSRLHDIAISIREGIEKRKEEELDPLIKSSDEHGKKILQVQDSILKKVQQRSDTITEYEKQGDNVIKKFDEFFKKRMETEDMLAKLEQQKVEMQQELDDLRSKAVAFNLASGKVDMKKHLGDLEKGFQDFDKRKSFFQKEVEKLKALVSG